MNSMENAKKHCQWILDNYSFAHRENIYNVADDLMALLVNIEQKMKANSQ